MQQQFTTALDGLTRQHVELEAELAQSRQQIASEQASTQAGSGSSTAWVADDGSRCGNTGAGKAERLLGCSRRVARLECSVQGVHWHSGATTAEADGASRESGSADPKRRDPAGRRSGSIRHKTLQDDADDLQGREQALNIVSLAGDCEGLESW